MKPIATQYWTPWGVMYRAYDDEMGADCSPYGEGKTEEEAISDLRDQVEELPEVLRRAGL